MEKSSNVKIQMSNQTQNPKVKMFSKTISYLSVNTQVVRLTVQGSGLFQFSSVNREPLTQTWLPSPVA
jgi:hypothetical protein